MTPRHEVVHVVVATHRELIVAYPCCHEIDVGRGNEHVVLAVDDHDGARDLAPTIGHGLEFFTMGEDLDVADVDHRREQRTHEGPGSGNLDPFRLFERGVGRRPDGNDRRDTVGMIHRRARDHGSAQRVPDQHGAVDVECVEHGQDRIGLSLHGAFGVAEVAPAIAEPIDRDQADGGAQDGVGEGIDEVRPVAGRAVHEGDDRFRDVVPGRGVAPHGDVAEGSVHGPDVVDVARRQGFEGVGAPGLGRQHRLRLDQDERDRTHDERGHDAEHDPHDPSFPRHGWSFRSGSRGRDGAG